MTTRALPDAVHTLIGRLEDQPETVAVAVAGLTTTGYADAVCDVIHAQVDAWMRQLRA